MSKEELAKHAERKDEAVDALIAFATPIGMMGLLVYFVYVSLVRQFGSECGVFSPFTRICYQLVALSVLISGCHMRMSERCKKCRSAERLGWSLVRIVSLGLFFYLAFRLLESYADGEPVIDNRVVDGSILLMWAGVALMGFSGQNSVKS